MGKHVTLYISEEMKDMIKAIKEFDNTFVISELLQRGIIDKYNQVQCFLVERKFNEVKKEKPIIDKSKEFAESFYQIFEVTKEQAILLGYEYNETPKEVRKSIFAFGEIKGLKERENGESK